MEEILASIRRIIADDQDGARVPASIAPTPQPAVCDDILVLVELKSSWAGSPRPEPEQEDELLGDADEPAETEDLPEDQPEPAAYEPPPPPPVQGPHSPSPRALPRSPEPDALLSGAAQATAAHAFQMLSTTVLNSNPRTLEALVKDMLRPLLKAWLDQNLPPLVERLVRAEIERVARGGL